MDIAIHVDDFPRDGDRCLDILDMLHDLSPTFKATLFCIPAEMGWVHFDQIHERPWLRAAIHGLEHKKGDCRGCDYGFERIKLMATRLMRFEPMAKPPWHGMSIEYVRACASLGITVVCGSLSDLPTGAIGTGVRVLCVNDHPVYVYHTGNTSSSDIGLRLNRTIKRLATRRCVWGDEWATQV